MTDAERAGQDVDARNAAARLLAERKFDGRVGLGKNGRLHWEERRRIRRRRRPIFHLLGTTMPVIYQGRCTACNATTAQFTDGCLAVYLDEPPPEVKKHSQNPHLVLIHPQDETILNQIGESITSAAEEGRLVWLELAVCRGCGRSYEIRRLSTAAAAFGLVVTLLVVLVCLGGGIGVAFLVGNNWVGWVSAIATIGALWTTFYFVLADSADRQVRSRHADRVAQLETVAQCPQCGSRDHAHPGALSEPIPCVACGGRSVVFDCVGIS